MSRPESDGLVSSGVDALIERLRGEGVASGRAEAEAILDEARREADQEIARARAEAEAIRLSARREADELKRATEEALRIAARDVMLGLKADLQRTFAADVRRLVGAELDERQLIRRMIVEVAGAVRDGAMPVGDEAVEVLLGPRLVHPDDERDEPAPEALAGGELTDLVFGIMGNVLRSGVVLKADGVQHKGIVVRLVEQGIEIDLSDEAIAAVILEHLQPRFRALLEGVIK